MAESYGNAFVNQFGEEPNPTWIAGLSTLTDEQLRYGFTNAMAAGSDFAPSLPAFIALCTPDDWEHNRQSRPAAEVLLDKPVDLGEGKHLPAPQDDRTPDEHIAGLKDLFKC